MVSSSQILLFQKMVDPLVPAKIFFPINLKTWRYNIHETINTLKPPKIDVNLG